MTLISKKCKTCNNYYPIAEFEVWALWACFTNRLYYDDCKGCRSKKHWISKIWKVIKK